MPVTFPLSFAAFLDLLSIGRSTIPALSDQVRQSRSLGGDAARSGRGERLWSGTITVAPLTRNETDQQWALLELLRAEAGSFLWYRRSRLGPQADPTGTILGAATPVIGALSGDARDLTITGLPAAYTLTRGDMISFAYGSPARQALHMVAATRTASGAGSLTQLSVEPLVRPGWSVGTAVTLVRPFCKAVVIPESVEVPDEGSSYAAPFRFRWMQTLK